MTDGGYAACRHPAAVPSGVRPASSPGCEPVDEIDVLPMVPTAVAMLPQPENFRRLIVSGRSFAFVWQVFLRKNVTLWTQFANRERYFPA
jgi:hypothetical protein